MNYSIQKRLLLGVLLITTSLLIIAGLVNYFWMNNVVNNLSEEKAGVIAERTASKIESYLLQKGQIAVVVSQQEQMHDFVENLSSRYQDTDQNPDYQELLKSFKRIVFNDPDINEVYIAVSKTKRIYDNSEYDNPPYYDATTRPWYIQAVKERRLVFTSPYVCPVTGRNVITASIPFYNDRGELLGVAAVDILTEKIQKIVKSVHVSDSGYAFMIDNKGTIVSHPHEGYLNYSLLAKYDFSSKADYINSRIQSGSSGFDRINDDDIEKYLFYSPLHNIGWSIAIILPVSDVTQTVSELGNIYIVTITLAIILIAVLVSFFTSRLSKPLEKLKELLRQINNRDYTSRIEIDSDDEFGQVIRGVNVMLDTQEGFIKEIGSIAYRISNSSHTLALKLGEMNSILPLITTDLNQLLEQIKSDPISEGNLEIDQMLQALMGKLINLTNLIRCSYGTGSKSTTDAYNYEDTELLNESFQIQQYINRIQIDFAEIINVIKDTNQVPADRLANLTSMKKQIDTLASMYANSLLTAEKTSSELITISGSLLEQVSLFKISEQSRQTKSE